MQHEFVGVITVFVENVERARRFYTEVVGLEVVEEVSTPGEVVLRSFRGPLIILQFDAEVSRRPVQPFGTELGLVVPDLEVAWARWQNADAVVLTEPHDYPLGRTFSGRSPSGHLLRFYELTATFDLKKTGEFDRVLIALRQAVSEANK
jgi:catechol 2,3-dioxygenase-like lactoylglutathione lyase family enzyme